MRIPMIPCLILAATLVACAPLQPGADPFVVRAEQTETIATAAFNLVVNMDDANRGFWQTNVPDFHAFANFLRTPITIETTNTLPKGLAMVKQLDDVKLAYKASTATSNALDSAIITLTAVVTQAQAWNTVVSNTVVPAPTTP